MEIVKGVMAGQAMKHNIGRVVKKWPPQVRVSKKDKKKLSAILSDMSRRSVEARKNGHTNGVTHAVAQVEQAAPLPTLTRILTDEHLAFFKRVANDERLPKDIRSEAFTHFLGE